MALSIQERFVSQLRDLLQELESGGAFRRFYTRPTALEEAAEYPYLFFRIAEDGQDEDKTHPQKIWKVRHSVHIHIVCDLDDDFPAGTLASKMAAVRRHLRVNHTKFSGITITSMRGLGNPEVGNAIDFARAVLLVEYTGLESD